VGWGAFAGWWLCGVRGGAGVDAEADEDVEEGLEVVAVSVGLFSSENLDGDERECPGPL